MAKPTRGVDRHSTTITALGAGNNEEEWICQAVQIKAINAGLRATVIVNVSSLHGAFLLRQQNLDFQQRDKRTKRMAALREDSTNNVLTRGFRRIKNVLQSILPSPVAGGWDVR